LNAGLKFRSLDDTVRDTLNWYRSVPEQEWPAGISRDKERDVLRTWNSRGNR
jgi:2'-hydroxyisoflavone reductase